MLVKDVKPIFNFSRNINNKDDIYKYVEEPMIPICEYLYDLNILTVMSSANLRNGCYLIIDYDTLSDNNKNVINELLRVHPECIKMGKYSIVPINNEVWINMPFNDKTTSDDVFKYYSELLKGLELQDIGSFLDCDNHKYNIYDIKNALLQTFIYFVIGTDMNIVYSEDEIEKLSDKIIELETALGLIRKKASDAFKFKICKEDDRYLLLMESGELLTSENQFLHLLKKYKDSLFLENSNFNLDNVNRDFILSQLNYLRNDNYIYNDEDDRFYYNQELIDRHRKYVKTLVKK